MWTLAILDAGINPEMTPKTIVMKKLRAKNRISNSSTSSPNRFKLLDKRIKKMVKIIPKSPPIKVNITFSNMN